MPKPATVEIKSLYYITHRENLPSILSRGILSHQIVEDGNIPYKAIYDAAIVGNRKGKSTPDGKSLWQYANVYFQPRNPMLYRVVHEKDRANIAIIGVQPRVLGIPGAFVTDGNAANDPTKFFPLPDGLKTVKKNWNVISSDWWNRADGSKRRIMAECLVPKEIPAEFVHSVYVADHKTADEVRKLVPSNIPVIPEPKMFFLPSRRHTVARHLFLVEGDMFFSTMHTLTVSVNTVGIMGKGLASRAKYQFPDVYVRYQDACRRKWLQMGKPYLYKREASLDDELFDEPGTLTTPNGAKWFLLFATKGHWKDDSDLSGIEDGMKWVAENYKGEGIRSLALPALGCGLGNLAWKDVGPVMCRHLAAAQIEVAIYLPREKEIPPEYLSPKFLLG